MDLKKKNAFGIIFTMLQALFTLLAWIEQGCSALTELRFYWGRGSHQMSKGNLLNYLRTFIWDNLMVQESMIPFNTYEDFIIYWQLIDCLRGYGENFYCSFVVLQNSKPDF